MYNNGMHHMRGMDQSQAQAQYYLWLPMELQQYDMGMQAMDYSSMQHQLPMMSPAAVQAAHAHQAAGHHMRGPSAAQQVAALAAHQSGTPGRPPGTNEAVFQLVQDLKNVEKREQALLELSQRRESVPDLAPILWHSFGTMSALIQEILCVYPALSPPPTLTAPASNRVCNALALLQCVASHQDTQLLFLKAQLPLLLYPFLNTVSKDKPFEYLRLTSLGVIGALVKGDDAQVVDVLLRWGDIIPLCLRIMDGGSDLSKTVATFVVQKLLQEDHSLNFICASGDHFYSLCAVLGKMTSQMSEPPSLRLLRHVVRCYLRLSDNAQAREVLKHQIQNNERSANQHFLLHALHVCLTMSSNEGSMGSEGGSHQWLSEYMREDVMTRRWLQQLFLNLELVRESPQQLQDQHQLSVPGGLHRVHSWQHMHALHQGHLMHHAGYA